MRRLLPLVALLAASCSYSEETAQIEVIVDGIPAAADHLDVVVTPSDTTVTGKNCPATVTVKSATCYRPSFQPDALGGGRLSMDFVSPVVAGAFTVAVIAADRNMVELAQGTVPGVMPVTVPGAMPALVNLQVTLH